MRRFLVWVGMFLATAGLALSIFLVPTLWGKPWSIDHFFLRTVAEFAFDHPMLLSYARILEPFGLDWYNDELEDLSVEAERAELRRVDRLLEGLAQYERDSLSREQALSADILEWFLTIQKDGEPYLFHSYPVSQFGGTQSSLPDFMVNFHAIEDPDDARDYIVRLQGFGLAFDQLIGSVYFRAERGVIPPRFVLDAVRDEVAGFVGDPPRKNPLYVKLENALDELDGLSRAGRESLLAQLETAIEETVYPAYGRLDDALSTLQGRATADDGVWKLPSGDAYYRWVLRYHTTTSLSPEQVYALGLAEVDRIHGEMRGLLEEIGLPSQDPIAGVRALGEDPRFLYPDSDEGREQILADYTAIIEQAQPRLAALFGRLPVAPVVVERVPVFKQAGAAGAYYNPPPFDGSRPGIFYANLRSVAEVQKFGMRTLAYHEAIPGHHFQIALSLENEALPLFRRVIPFTAYIEGWALYAERLAAEHGFYPTPEDELGHRISEIFRAVRLVVDTGIHARRWSRERAIDYMLDNTGMPKSDVVAEIERYIVNPGQACAYKIGELKIVELRERARRRLGAAFDLSAFHDAVLGIGAVPLEILEREIDRWIDEYSGLREPSR